MAEMNLANYASGQQPPVDRLRTKLPATGGITGGGKYGAFGGPGSDDLGMQLRSQEQATPLSGQPAGATPTQQPAQPAAAPPAAAAPAPAAGDPFQGQGVQLASGQWVPKNHPLAAQAGPAAAGAPGAAGAPANPLGDVFRQALIARISANPTPTSVADDPALAAQSGAFRQAQARDAARTRSQGIEALGANGLESSGAAGSMVRKVGADRALAEGTFDAGLLGNARDQRMQELQAFLGIAGNTLSNEERNALDREMGNLDASVRREGIGSQASLGAGDLALRGELGRGGLQQNLLSILLNNRTDNDRTALSGAGLELGANTDALRALLGGR